VLGDVQQWHRALLTKEKVGCAAADQRPLAVCGQ
jgi:hypothetical protein